MFLGDSKSSFSASALGPPLVFRFSFESSTRVVDAACSNWGVGLVHFAGARAPAFLFAPFANRAASSMSLAPGGFCDDLLDRRDKALPG